MKTCCVLSKYAQIDFDTLSSPVKSFNDFNLVKYIYIYTLIFQILKPKVKKRYIYVGVQGARLARELSPPPLGNQAGKDGKRRRSLIQSLMGNFK